MRAYATPMRISAMGQVQEHCSTLEALPLKSGGSGPFSESWLQQLIHKHPSLLPIDQIEPALAPAMPVATELPLPCGFVDNLLMTRDGGLVAVETKLWRNPEARRQVVGQVLEYAKDLSRLDYTGLQQAVRTARKDPTIDLFREVLGEEAEAHDEARFVDAVSQNLRNGRLLLIIAGDGVHENLEALADFLQRHLGLHFTLALVEISFWRASDTGDVFVQPKVMTRTVQIERAVVRLEPSVALTPTNLVPGPAAAKPVTLSAEAFYDQLRQVDGGLPERLQKFLHEAEPLGVHADVKRGMTLKWRAPDGRTFRLAHISLDGRVATDFANDNAAAIHRVDLSHAYQASLAELLPGASVRQTPSPLGWRVVIGQENPPLASLLDHQAAWIAAILDYAAELERALAPSEMA